MNNKPVKEIDLSKLSVSELMAKLEKGEREAFMILASVMAAAARGAEDNEIFKPVFHSRD